jgi:hypothetical protein
MIPISNDNNTFVQPMFFLIKKIKHILILNNHECKPLENYVVYTIAIRNSIIKGRRRYKLALL